MDTAESWANSAASGVSGAFDATKSAVWSRDYSEDSKKVSETASSWASYASSGVSSAFNSTKSAVASRDYAEDSRSATESAASWAGWAASGVGGAFGAAKRVVWSDGEPSEEARNGATAVGVATKNAVGVFKQVNSFGKPNIYKHVSGGQLGWRQINEHGSAIFKPTAANGFWSALGNITLMGAVAMDAFEIGEAVNKDYWEGSYNHTAVKSASVAGSWAGAIPGAMVGAAVLSWIPLVGTLIGGVGGGIAGAVYGSAGGEAAVKKLLPVEDKPGGNE